MIIEILLITLFIAIVMMKKDKFFSSFFVMSMLVGVAILLYANLRDVIIFSSYNYRFDFEYGIYKFLTSFRFGSVFLTRWIVIAGIIIYVLSNYLMSAMFFEYRLSLTKIYFLTIFILLSVLFAVVNAPIICTKLYEGSYVYQHYKNIALGIKMFNVSFVSLNFAICIYMSIKKIVASDIFYIKKTGVLFLIFQIVFDMLVVYICLASQLRKYFDPMKINMFVLEATESSTWLNAVVPLMLIVIFVLLYLYLSRYSVRGYFNKKFWFFKNTKKMSFDEVSHLFHSYKNALNAINFSVNKLEQNYGKPEGLDNIQVIKETIGEFNRRSIKLLEYYKGRPIIKNECDICDCVKAAVNLSNIDKEIEVKTKFQPNVPLFWASEDSMTECFTNIIVNAAEELGRINKNGKTIYINIFEQNGVVCIEIKDNGNGVSKKNLRKILKPLYTTKRTYSNWGIGLSQSIMIIKKHHGDMCIRSKINIGTTVQISFVV